MASGNNETHLNLVGGAPRLGSADRPRIVCRGDELHDPANGELLLEIKRLANVVQELKEAFQGNSKDFYTVAEIAEKTHRSEYTVRRWITEHKIKATRVEGTGPKGRFLIPRAEISRLVAMGNGSGVSGMTAARSAS